MPTPSRPSPPVAAAPRAAARGRGGRALAWLFAAVAAGPGVGSAPVAAVADAPPQAPPAPLAAPKGRLFDPAFREGRPSEVLVDGDLPLLRGVVDAFVDVLEATHDLYLPQADEIALRDEIETAWTTMGDEERRFFDRVAIDRDRLRPVPGSKPDAAAVRAFSDGFVAALAPRTAAARKGWPTLVRRALERKAEVFSASPEPPVHGHALDAFEDTVLFAVGLARNSEVAPTPGQRLAVRPQLRATMDASGPAVRRVYARWHRVAALLKARWDAADEAGRLRVRYAVLKVFRRIAKLPVPSGPVVIDLPGYATLAAEVAGALNVPDAYTSGCANPGELLSAFLEGFDLSGKGAEGDLDTLLAYDRLFLR